LSAACFIARLLIILSAFMSAVGAEFGKQFKAAEAARKKTEKKKNISAAIKFRRKENY